MEQTIINVSKRYIPHGVRMALRRLNWKRLYATQTLFSNGKEAVYCPIAERPFKKFIDHNNDKLSPTNGARSRQRLVWHYLKHVIGVLDKPMNVLHVAPEGPFLEILSKQPGLEYFPGDKMVEGYGDQQGVNNIDLTALELPSDSFHLVICNHVLEHIPDDAAAMREMYRVLRIGGKAVITVPIKESLPRTYEDPSITSPADRRKHFGQWDHVRFYSLDIKDRLAQAGFLVELVRYGERFTRAEYQRLGFCDDVIVVAVKG